jgi:cysteine desulfurase
VFGSDVLGLATGLAASTGSACQASHNTPSAVLIALGVEPAVAMGAVRLSLGHDNNREEITAAIDLLVNAYRRTIE